MQQNKCSRWSVGLKFVQFMKNSVSNSGIQRSAYEAMFGCVAKVGLEATSLPREILHTLKSEEELESIYLGNTASNQASSSGQNENTTTNSNSLTCISCDQTCVDNTTCMICDQCVHLSCAKKYNNFTTLCLLCFQKAKIEREREGAVHSLEKQAKRMKILSDTKHGEVVIGSTVRVPVPDTDRGKGDSRNILAVVIKKTDDGFYTLGTRNGKLKQLYARSQFTVCDENLISIDEVPDVEFSLRSVATMQSNGTGQGVKKCTCKSKCQTRKCACFKNGRLCTSRCHNSLPCCNK